MLFHCPSGAQLGQTVLHISLLDVVNRNMTESCSGLCYNLKERNIHSVGDLPLNRNTESLCGLHYNLRERNVHCVFDGSLLDPTRRHIWSCLFDLLQPRNIGHLLCGGMFETIE